MKLQISQKTILSENSGIIRNRAKADIVIEQSGNDEFHKWDQIMISVHCSDENDTINGYVSFELDRKEARYLMNFLSAFINEEPITKEEY